MRCFWLCGLLFASFEAAAAEAQFSGPQACAPCHPSQYEKQIRSRHALALRSIAQSPWPSRIDPIRDGGFTTSYESGADSVQVAVDGPGASIKATLNWAFGAGAQGVTPVGVENGRYFEHRFSFYTRQRQLAPTFGHPERPTTAGAELGVFQDRRTISQCFQCHATGAGFGAAGPDLSEMRPGVTCERCHGPGRAHVEAARSGSASDLLRRTIVNPKRFDAKARVEICGECHRLPSPDTGPEPEIEDPVTVRFAPVGLMASRCFSQSRTLSCTTCHDPHGDAQPRSNLAAYSGQCLGCHSGAVAATSRCKRGESRDCVSCHMPLATLGRYLRFTDHRIRVK